MPKRLRQQKRGKGTSVYSAPDFKYKYVSKYRTYDDIEKNGILKGKVIDIVNDIVRSCPLMIVKFENGDEITVPAPYYIKVGDEIQCGKDAAVSVGNIIPLKNIPPGTDIYNIELNPGDCGKVVRSAGSSAKIISHEGNKTIVRLPSKQFKSLSSDCRATIGIAAGFGKLLKPIAKAGKHYHMLHSRGIYWPHVCGVAMNRVNHPFGGKRRSTQKKDKTRSRRLPPGKKVGSIAARRTGYAKKR